MPRGEREFIRLPSFAAGLYDSLARTRAIQVLFRQVALELTSRLASGCLLDIGTGPGHLLRAIHDRNPGIELYGLDISPAMVLRARKNLEDVPVILRVGSIRRTDFPDCRFDLVTSTGSFYLWDEPVGCLDEIHRILKPGGVACIYESRSDYEVPAFEKALQQNLQQETVLRRWLSPFFLRRQLRMTYSSSQVNGILERTQFAGNFQVEKIVLGGLPAWLRIELRKR
jgi:ubiquinone/menaquinone biosynthesis C-methylase UbiE